MIIMFAKEKSAKKFNLEKFEPMVEVTPRLSAKLPVHAGRDKNNLWDHKTFARGFLKFITSNAPDDVKSTPAPVVAVEEPDDANQNVREQGDSITLLEERNKSYSDSRRKVIFGGTPTIDGFSRIAQAYESSDQRRYLVPCPDCGEEHELAWDNVTWSENAEAPHEVFGLATPASARYACPFCGSLWDDTARFRAVRRGRWVATAAFHGVAGFRLNELVSPFPGSRLAELVKKRLVAEKALRAGDDTKMRSFVNNPADATDKAKVTVKRRRLTFEEFQAIYEKAPQVALWLQNAMLLALVSGQDRSTIARWERSFQQDGHAVLTRGKTGVRIAIPLELRMDVLGMSLADVIARCRSTGIVSKYLVHHIRPNVNAPKGAAIKIKTFTSKFKEARDLAGITGDDAPTFHEMRSLTKRLYMEQGGVDTKALLGHMTDAIADLYANSRGLEPLKVKISKR